MNGVNLNRLSVFAAVVAAGSFTGAAKRLGSSKAAVSEHIARLEEEVGATLLLRNSRQVIPTDAGEALYDAANRILDEADAAITEAGRETGRLAGSLRVTSPTDLGSTVLPHVAAMVAAEHPDLRIDLVVTDRPLDLVAERVDLAIRVGWLADSSLMARRIASVGQSLVGAPSYLQANGRPRTPADLAAHRWVAFTSLHEPRLWRFASEDRTEDVTVKPSIGADAAMAVQRLVLDGAGLSILPDYLVSTEVRDGLLEQLLPDWDLPEVPIQAVYPPTRYRPAKVRLFVDAFQRTLDGAACRGKSASFRVAAAQA
jgi:DNA-binding transcriptional LysR family regulator